MTEKTIEKKLTAILDSLKKTGFFKVRAGTKMCDIAYSLENVKNTMPAIFSHCIFRVRKNKNIPKNVTQNMIADVLDIDI